MQEVEIGGFRSVTGLGKTVRSYLKNTSEKQKD
jgi:hypothetical protein